MEEKAGFFAIIVLQMYCYYNVLWLFLTGLQCVIVVFLDHTHLLFKDLSIDDRDGFTSLFYPTFYILNCMYLEMMHC